MQKTIRCPTCHGSGLYGYYSTVINGFVDYECPKCKGKGRIKMRIHDAISICGNISSGKYTDKEKMEAIRVAWKSVSKTSLTKPKMMKVVDYLLEQLEGKQ